VVDTQSTNGRKIPWGLDLVRGARQRSLTTTFTVLRKPIAVDGDRLMSHVGVNVTDYRNQKLLSGQFCLDSNATTYVKHQV
jgi:hypothetical protein